MFLQRREVKITIILIILFIAASYFSHRYSETLSEDALLKGENGIILYIIIVAAGVLIAAVSTLPLLPIAVSLWGPDLAAIYTIIGWSGGSLLALGIARRYGQKLVCRFIDRRDIEKYREELPKKNIFWPLVLARIFLPVDIISYAVGLFTKMHWGLFFLATVLGTSIFSFFFAYASELPIIIQLAAGSILLLLIIFRYKRLKAYIRKLINSYKN